MKQLFTIIILWLVAEGFTNAAGPTISNTTEAPLAVELNGVISFFGVRHAFFVLHQPGSAPCSFMLAEGETRFGIKLLAVEGTLNHVQIENSGQKQTLRICSTPALSSASGMAGPGETIFARGANGPGGSSGVDGAVDENVMAGNPGWGTLAASSNSSDSEQNSNPDQNSAANPNGPDPATTLKAQSNTDWYQESAGIEVSRKETAQQVLAGEMTPWPLTPLTPAGTPRQLIATDGIFANHMPGFLKQ
jgi:hypothetical protein